MHVFRHGLGRILSTTHLHLCLCLMFHLYIYLCLCIGQERVRELEAAAMADREWHLRGEVAALHRPLNSALEVDADFDTTGVGLRDCSCVYMCV